MTLKKLFNEVKEEKENNLKIGAVKAYHPEAF